MTVAAALLFLAGAAPAPCQDAALVQPIPSDPRAALPRLIELMRAGIGVREPNNGWFKRFEGGSVFDGSYDWHSCVLAHFALLTHARQHEDAELAAFVLGRLDGPALRHEAALLAERDRRRHVTFPYDEAWFLMLLAELARHEGAHAQAVQETRTAIEQRLLEHLEQAPFPEGVPEVEYCGFYRSWLFAFLLVQLSQPVGEDAGARLEALRRGKLGPLRADVAAHVRSHEWDFLFLPAVLALIERTAPEPARSPYDPGAAAALPEGVTIATVHRLGVALSRLWPCAYDGGRGDAAARARFEASTRAVLAREDLWAEDFAACSHWVPQYLWLGLWLADGCP